MLECPLRGRYPGQSGHRESCTQQACLILTRPRNFPIRGPTRYRVAVWCNICFATLIFCDTIPTIRQEMRDFRILLRRAADLGGFGLEGHQGLDHV